jgi:hypothetical protein
MRKVNVSDINSAAGMPIYRGTIEHMQLSHMEETAAIAKSLIGITYDETKCYRLYGGELTNAYGDFYYNNAGAFLYQNEIFLVDEIPSISPVAFNEGIGLTVSTTQYTTFADPVTFSDLTVKNVHDIRKMVYFNTLTQSVPFPINYLKPEYITVSVSTINNAQLTFRENLAYRESTVFFGGSLNIYCNPTDAIRGCNVKLLVNTDSAIPVNILGTASGSIAKFGATMSNTVSNVFIDITYMGNNIFQSTVTK